MNQYTGTYSPDDNKLRLYAFSRLDAELYARVKEAGFRWAPKQDLFVAPMWTPARADLLIELCGEIGDEDTSLSERAEQRADRFGDYSHKRKADADRAYKAVSAIADNIPFGQPILVGHHSEKRARKDAQRIDSGMRKAVDMWDTAQYWTSRAAGAIRAAKYKERPDVRARRIKTIEADKRKQERYIAEAEKALTLWNADGLTLESAKLITGSSYFSRCFTLAEFPRNPPASQYEGEMGLWSALDGGVINEHQARELATASSKHVIAWANRWVAHYDNRLAYERAMLGEQGGLASDQFNFEVGGQVLIRGEWLLVLRINKSGGRINSITHKAPSSVHWSKDWKTEAENIKDYRAPSAEDAAKVKAAIKPPPLVNYPGEGFLQMTKAEYDRTVPQWSDFPKVGKIAGSDTCGAHRVRQTRKPGGQFWDVVAVFLSDIKRTDPPAKKKPDVPLIIEAQPVAIAAESNDPEAALRDIWTAKGVPEEKQAELFADISAKAQPGAQVGPFTILEAKPAKAEFETLRERLKEGVQVVSAPQLFPTPPELAARMVTLAEIDPSHAILEPSGGTGRIIKAIRDKIGNHDAACIAVEIKPHLAEILRSAYRTPTHCADFLTLHAGNLGTFDRILMNPPFVNAEDIKHIQHAVSLLNPGGRLVAICANGPRQNEQLRPLADEWESLPPGTFAASGTLVNAVLLVINN